MDGGLSSPSPAIGVSNHHQGSGGKVPEHEGFSENREEETRSVLPEGHLSSVETLALWSLAVGADGEIIKDLGEDEVVVLLILPILLHVQFDQSPVRNYLLSFAKESVSQSGHGLILQGEVNNVFKRLDLTAGGAGEGAVLKNQLLVKGKILIFKLGKPRSTNL